MVVYAATNSVNGKQYVGITTRSLAARVCDHKSHSKKNKEKFYKAIRKHGFDNFVWSVIDSANCETALRIKEMQHIKRLDSQKNGYNSGCGGDVNSGFKWSDASKAKASASKKALVGAGWRPTSPAHTEAQKEKWRTERSGAKHPAFGLKRSDAHKARISAANKGKIVSEATRAKLRNRFRVLDYAQIMKMHNEGIPATKIALSIGASNSHVSTIIKNIKGGIICA